MYYSEDVIEDVRSRNDIVDVINSYVHLEKSGSDYQACCPFHQEKHASFKVSRNKQMYYCFGCHEAGNVFTFLMKYENMTFGEAIKELADRAGMKLPEREWQPGEKEKADYRASLLEMNKVAAGYFHYLLKQEKGKRGYEYLRKRGISDEVIAKFALGFADVFRDDLYQYLKHKGYTDQLLKDSGLVELDEVQGGRDKFWNRVMYPILDANGKVIGFGGRVMGEGEPKYLNSKETAVFNKRRNLYGLWLAKKSKRKGIILCEGYMDVISMHQAGFDNAVASLGTAFTPEQAQLLKRYTDKVYLAYDSDGAGTKAAMKAIRTLAPFGYSVRIIDMQPYKDPDEFIQNLGVEGFEERIDKAKSAMEFQMAQLAKEYQLDDPEEKTRFQKELVDLLTTIEEPMERNNYCESAARIYHMDAKLLQDRVNQIGYRQVTGEVDEETPVKRRVDRQKLIEETKKESHKLLLTYFVNEPLLIEKLKDMVEREDFYQPVMKEVAEAIYDQYEKTGDVMPAMIINQFTDLEQQKQAAEICQTTLKYHSDEEDERQILTDLVRKVKLESIQHRIGSGAPLEQLQKLLKQKAEILNWQMPK